MKRLEFKKATMAHTRVHKNGKRTLPFRFFFLILVTLFQTQGLQAQGNDCPTFPKRGTFDRATFIRTQTPTDPTKADGIYLGQGTIFRAANDIRRAFIPDNRPEHAIAIAHAWNYHRNLVHRVENPPIGYWLATIVQESEYMCDPGAVWSDPNEAPPLYTTDPAAYLSRANDLATGISGTAGCFQIEGTGSAWFQLGQNYPQGRFPESQWINLTGNDGTFVNAALVKSYYDVYTKEVYQYQIGQDVYESIDCTLDDLAYVKTSASGYNGGINGFGSNANFFNGSEENNNNWTNMAATTAGYADDVAKWTAVLEDDTDYPTYPAGSSFGGYYNDDISWADMTTYLDQAAIMYTEFNFATDIVPAVQAAFEKIAGSTSGTIPFSELGPVIDELILALPREFPQIVEGSPSGINPTTCSGNKIPYAGIEILSGPSDLEPGNIELCLGESITFQINVEGGGGPDPQYRWFSNDDNSVTLSTERIYTVTPTVVGTESFSAEVCNENGCYKIGTTAENDCMDSRNANGFWINTLDCSTCSFAASATKVNTPCKGMSAGSITLNLVNAPANYRITYSATTPLGVINDSFTASGSSFTLSDIRDGSYSFELEDINDPSCKAFTSVIVGFDTDINEYVDAEITSIDNCVADIEANIVELPQPCTWKVQSTDPTTFQWSLNVLATIRTSSGLLLSDVYTVVDPSPNDWHCCTNAQVFEAEFELYTGDTIWFGTALTTALGSQFTPYDFKLFDETGTEVYTVRSPANSAQPNSPPIEVGSYVVTCPYTPPSDYNFSWSPALANEVSTTVSSSGTAAIQPNNDVTYVVTATNASNPTCVLTDSVTVVQDPSCVPSCAPPTDISLTPASVTLCEGANHSVSAAVTGTAVQEQFYFTWYDQDGAAISGKQGLTSSDADFDELSLTSLLPTQSGTYTLRVEDGNNGNALCYLEETFEITVDAATDPEITIAATTTNICDGGAVSFSVQSSDVGSSPNYSWNASVLGNGQSTNTTWNNASGLSEGETVVLAVSNITGCYSATSVTSDPITLNVADLPSGYSLSLPSDVCQSTDGFSISVTGGNDASDFVWSLTNATLTSDTTGLGTNTITVNVGTTDPQISVTPVNSCGNQSAINETLNLNAIPSASILTSGTALGYCQDAAGVTLTAQDAGAGASYSWSGPVTGSNSSLDNATAGSYTVEVSVNGCSATSSSVTVMENGLPTASFANTSETICSDNSQSTTLTISTTGNPSTVVYNDGSADISLSAPFEINTSNSGTFTLVSVTDGTCSNSATGSATVDYYPELDTTNFDVSCDANDNVIISFEVTGGTPAGYVVRDIAGSFSGSLFTSTPLAELTNHDFTIEDGTNCNSLTSSVFKSCSCPEVAIISGGGTICEDGSTTDLSISLTGGSSYTFDLLLDGQPEQIGIATSNSVETIAVSSPGTYTLANFVGTCPGTSQGSAVVSYHDFPTAVISGDASICNSDLTSITIDFKGATPFDFRYFGDGSTGSVPVSNHGSIQYQFNTSSNEVFTMESLVDGNGCTARAQDLMGSATIAYRSSPDTASVSLSCDQNDDYIITVEVTNGDASTYSILGAEGSFSGTTWTSAPIEENLATTLTLSDLFDCNPIIFTKQQQCSCPANAVLSGGGQRCEGDGQSVDVQLALSGQGPWDVTLNTGTADTLLTGIGSSAFVFTTTAPRNYSVVSVSDANCQNTGSGTADVIVNTLPEFTVSGGGVTCENDPTRDVVFNFTGTVPFSYAYSIGGGTVTNSSADPSITLNNPAEGTYLPLGITDGNGCTGTVLSGSATVSTIEAPSGSVMSDVIQACANETPDAVTFEFTGSGNYTFVYSDGSNQISATATGSTFELQNPGDGVYTLVSLNDGCEAAPQDLTGQSAVIVHPLPKANFEGGGDLCDDGVSQASLSLRLEGQAPWSVTYNAGADGATLLDFSLAENTLSTMIEGTYEVTALEDGNGCQGIDFGATSTVTLVDLPAGTPSQVVVEACETGEVSLTASGTGTITWWKDSEEIGANPLVLSTPEESGTYRIEIDNGVCNPSLTVAEPVEVKIWEQPTVDAGSDQTIYIGESLNLEASTDFGTITWSPATTLSVEFGTQTVATPIETTLYTATATNGECTDFDEVEVAVQLPIEVPTAFTPNGDGMNEVWNISGIETYPNVVVRIFNRWGNEVYTSSGYDDPWDGTLKGKILPTGTYYWVIDLNDLPSDENQPASFEGTITIIR